jgi:hypothetical protein
MNPHKLFIILSTRIRHLCLDPINNAFNRLVLPEHEVMVALDHVNGAIIGLVDNLELLLDELKRKSLLLPSNGDHSLEKVQRY